MAILFLWGIHPDINVYGKCESDPKFGFLDKYHVSRENVTFFLEFFFALIILS